MRILPLSFLFLATAAFPALAQLAVEVTVDQEQFLRDEAIKAKVRITNHSGQTLKLGADNSWLAFSIEGLDSGSVARLGDVQVAGEFTLESAHVATRTVDLTQGFDLSEPGRYNVTGTVRIKDWGVEVPSKPLRIEVVRGTKVWEQEFGVPGATGAPETRRFILQHANYQKRLMLYLRVADLDDRKVFRVMPLGPVVSFSRPEALVDQNSELNVLFQSGARSFLFYVIRPDGEIAIRQSYDYAGSRPSLRQTEEGRIFVGGGARRVAQSDIPAPVAVLTSAAPAPAASQATNSVAGDPLKPDGKKKKKN